MSLASTLKIRAKKLEEARGFFRDRNCLEIDCPALQKCAPLDAHIDCLSVENSMFLHTSPEYALKKLMSKGIKDCYFLGHVYRKDESGEKHEPEFTMAEWYRIGFSIEKMIEETSEFLSLFLGPLPLEVISFQQAYLKYAQIDPFTISEKELQNRLNQTWSHSECLDYILAEKIEPFLGKKTLTAIIDYPADRAALARLVTKNGKQLAARFEIYFEGIELANGYHESNDPVDIQSRFKNLNAERIKEGKPPYQIDEELLRSLPNLPDCCGVALGFDRALMLHMKQPSIQKVLPIC